MGLRFTNAPVVPPLQNRLYPPGFKAKGGNDDKSMKQILFSCAVMWCMIHIMKQTRGQK